MRDERTELNEPGSAGASGGWPAAPPTRGTMYGPAIGGTVRVDEHAAALLRALRPPEVPRPVVAAPPPLPRSRLAIAGLALAIPASPLGLVLSAIALANILSGRWRCRGEHLALAGVVASVLAITGALVLII